MEDDLDLIIDNGDKPLFDGKRPVFVTVLCILTFVGAGFGIISGIIGLFTMGAMEELTSSITDMDEAFETEIGMDFQNMYRWSKIAQILALVGSVLCLAGALFMWHLKKSGFFIYVLGQVLPIIGTFLTMNSMFSGAGMFGGFAGFGYIMTFLAMIFPLAFIVMYALNLKYMK